MKTLRNRLKTLPAIPRPDRRQIAGGAIFLWVALSPWLWGFADSHAAVANHVALVFGFAPLALIMVNLRPAAIVTLLAGVWLIASPWVLGYATDHAAWLNELVSGAALVALCANVAGVGLLRHARTKRTPTPAGTPVGVAKTAGSGS
jgi:SPW repeat-containing protein